MGSIVSINDETKFNEIYNNLTQRPLPLNICFLVHNNNNNNNHHNQTSDINGKINEILEIIETKYVNKQNNYAILRLNKDDVNIGFIDFCEYSHMNRQMYDVYKVAINEHHTNQRPDLYKHAYLNLNWTNSIKILFDLNFSSSRRTKNSPYRTQLINNYGISIFELNSMRDLEILTFHLRKLGTRHVKAKYVPRYKFTTPYSQKKEIFFPQVKFERFINNESSSSSAAGEENNYVTRHYIVNDFEGASKMGEGNFWIDYADVWIEDVPFAEGKEVYCFKGWIRDERTRICHERVFKLAKYEEINLMDNLMAQNIARYLAKKYSK